MKQLSILKWAIILGGLTMLFLLLLPALMHAPSKYTPRKTPPGVPTVLQQIEWATARYGLEQGKEPRSLYELEGITVLTSKGEKTPFSIKGLEQELGTNVSIIVFLPEFGALDYGTVPSDENVLAHVPDFKRPGWSHVIFRSGRIERLRSAELQIKIEQLKGTLKEFEATNKAPRQARP